MREIIVFVAVLFFLHLADSAFAANLLLNPSFEDPASGSPTSWTKSVSTATLSTSTTFKTGTSSASINKTNSSTGLIYLYQDIDVEPDAFYSLSGYVVKNSANFSWVILRISWRSSSAEISKTDSSQLTSDSSDFQLLKIDSAQAPSQAIKARVELVANIETINPSNPALFDDIDFSQIPAPDQPTPTTAPTNTPTPAPDITSTPTPTLTPIPTSAPESTTDEDMPPNTPASNPNPMTSSMLDQNAPPDSVLGESTGNKLDISPPENLIPDATKKPDTVFQWISIVLGIVFISACAILTFRIIKRGELTQNEEE